MRAILLTLILAIVADVAIAADCRALVEGAGCRTRQLAIQRIWESMPLVTEVEILPREEAPAANHRYFIIRSEGATPNRSKLIEALGRRAKYCKVKTLEPETSK